MVSLFYFLFPLFSLVFMMNISQAERLRQLRDPNRGIKVGGSSSPSSSGGGSSGGSSSSAISKLTGKGTYDIKTLTYTSPSGQKQSMTFADALRTGAVIVDSGSTYGRGGGGSSGGATVLSTSQIQQAQQQMQQQQTQQAQKAAAQKAAVQKKAAQDAFRQKYIESTKIKNLQIISPAGRRQSLSPSDFNRQVGIYEKRFKNNPINEKSFKDIINTIGATTSSRKSQLKISELNKERDRIYSDLSKITNLFPSELTESQYYQYQKLIAPLVARYNLYNDAKQIILKSYPDKKAQASLEYNPGLGENVLVLNNKDLSLSNKIAEAINKTTTKVSRGKNVGVSTAILAGLTAVGLTVETIRGFAKLPSTVLNVIKNPSVIKQLPSAVKQSGVATGKLIQVSPTAGLVRLGGEIYLWTKAPGDAIKLVRRVGAQSRRLSPLFRGVKETSLGVRSIRNVNKVGDIEIILNRGEKLKTKPLKVIKEAQLEGKLKLKPTLAKTTKIEKKLLKVVKKRGDVVTGSYARETLLKKSFARKHKDLDIASSNVPALQRALKKEFGKSVRFVKKPNSILVKVKGKSVADLVPLAKAEGGLIRRFGAKKVNGLKLADPRAIIGGKATKLGSLKLPRSLKKSQFGKVSKKARTKTLKDIEKLTGQKALKRPALTGAFGFTKKEMSAYLGKSGPLTTAQADLLVKGLLKRNPTLKNERWLYATPWEVATGKAQVRVSRLGLKSEEATLMELLKGQASFFKKGKPQIFVLPKEKIFKAGQKLSKAKTIKTPKGFVVPNFSSELEVVLGKGYILKRGKTLGRTIIGGESVPIVELQKVKLSKALQSELKTYNKLQKRLASTVKRGRKLKSPSLKKKVLLEEKKLIKRIDSKERSLNVKIKKKTGFDYFSSPTKVKKYYPVGKRSLSAALKVSRFKAGGKSRRVPRKKISKKTIPSKVKRTTIKRKISRPVKRKPISRKTFIRKIPKRSVPRTPSKRTVPLRVSKPIRRPSSKAPPGRSYTAPRRVPNPKIITAKIGKKKPRRKKQKKVSMKFDVYARPVKGKKFRKINTKALSKSRAYDYGAFATDNSLSRTFKVVKKGKKVRNATTKPVNKPLNVPKGYYSRNVKKFRDFRKVKGRKKPIKSRIEISKYLLDTKREKKKITLSKLLSGKKPVKKKVVKRKPIRKVSVKRTPAKRKIIVRKKVIRRTGKSKATPAQLKSLRKARRVLAQKRRKK